MLLTVFYALCSITWACIQYQFLDRDDEKFSQNVEIIITNCLSNLLCGIILINFSTIAIWQYMRINDFLAPEVFEYAYLYDYIGLDFLILNVFVIFVLPILLAFSKVKKIKIVGLIFILICIFFSVMGIFSNREVTIPTLLFVASIILYMFGTYWAATKAIYEFRQNRQLPKQKLQKSSLISAIILILLILIPDLTLESFTQHTLQRMKLGGFNVTIRTDDKRVLEGFLLLKTKEFYYVHPRCEDKNFEEDIVIIQTSNTTLAYKSE